MYDTLFTADPSQAPLPASKGEFVNWTYHELSLTWQYLAKVQSRFETKTSQWYWSCIELEKVVPAKYGELYSRITDLITDRLGPINAGVRSYLEQHWPEGISGYRNEWMRLPNSHPFLIAFRIRWLDSMLGEIEAELTKRREQEKQEQAQGDQE